MAYMDCLSSPHLLRKKFGFDEFGHRGGCCVGVSNLWKASFRLQLVGMIHGLVDLLHLATLGISISFLQNRHVSIGISTIVVNAQAQLQHSVNSVAKGVGLLQAEARASALFLSSSMMEFSGLISIVFLLDMYPAMLESLSACAFMILSMLAVHPYSPVTKQHGESTTRSDTTTFSTLSPSTSLITLQRPSNFSFRASCFFFSSSLSSSFRPSLVAETNFLPSKSFN
ncbi:hypothetical protein RJ639_025110 [Escallonia herrerae]|uniref:Uncharacterized protein n=1 Tax=Escallonia herrerae TaxID=1293975 RepID=A0AA88UXU5_9ASTE|nr:hypothetical protein RJ639_025110 [Escallonia herrerae]